MLSPFRSGSRLGKKTYAIVEVFPGMGVLMAAAFLTGCQPLPPSKPPELLTPGEARGARVFQNDCARCHYPTSTRGLRGPGLQALTKVKALPSGAPPTDENLIRTILHGHGMMSPVPVSDEEMPYLLAYLHTL
jgi:mono/diheme cytochrome c family protein